MSSTNLKTDTLIVFDWDNTLFPTKPLQLIHSQKDKTKFEELHALSQWTYSVLYSYISHYSSRNICIVTAAKHDWVESCLLRMGGIGWWPAIRNLIFDPAHPIRIIYPQSTMLPFKTHKEVLSYKCGAFRNLVQAYRPRMLVSIGDSRAEYVASKRCAKCVKGMSVGRVLLKCHPTISTMIQQNQFVLDLCTTVDPVNFDIDLSSDSHSDK